MPEPCNFVVLTAAAGQPLADLFAQFRDGNWPGEIGRPIGTLVDLAEWSNRTRRRDTKMRRAGTQWVTLLCTHCRVNSEVPASLYEFGRNCPACGRMRSIVGWS